MKNQYLLDTHTLLWMQDDNDMLSETVRDKLTDEKNDLYISIASFWEITIKQSLGKLQLAYTLDDLVQSSIINSIFILPVQISYLKTLKSLPFIHRDPFDRLIIATAIEMNHQLLSCDRNVQKYDLKVVW